MQWLASMQCQILSLKSAIIRGLYETILCNKTVWLSICFCFYCKITYGQLEKLKLAESWLVKMSCMQYQVSSLETDVRLTYWPTCMECQVSSLESDASLPTGLHAWNARCQAWNLMSGLPTGLHACNARCQAWNLMSGLPTGLHACNARCQAWNLVSLASIHGKPCVKTEIWWQS